MMQPGAVPKEAFSASARPHAHDARIWYTDDPVDLKLAFHEAVKAVIWLRDPSIHEEPGEKIIRAIKSGKKAWAAQQIQKIAQADLGASDILSRIDVHDTDWRNAAGDHAFHADNSQGNPRRFLRFMCGLKGTGPVFWAGNIGLAALIRARFTRRLPDGFPAKPSRVIQEACPQGAVIGFKSFGAGVDPATVLIHSTPAYPNWHDRVAYVAPARLRHSTAL